MSRKKAQRNHKTYTVKLEFLLSFALLNCLMLMPARLPHLSCNPVFR